MTHPGEKCHPWPPFSHKTSRPRAERTSVGGQLGSSICVSLDLLYFHLLVWGGGGGGKGGHVVCFPLWVLKRSDFTAGHVLSLFCFSRGRIRKWKLIKHQLHILFRETGRPCVLVSQRESCKTYDVCASLPMGKKVE